MNVVKIIHKGLDESFSGVAEWFFDLSKAFDLVDHRILLQKLRFYGIRGRKLLLFESYFANRKQYVNIKNAKNFIISVEWSTTGKWARTIIVYNLYK